MNATMSGSPSEFVVLPPDQQLEAVKQACLRQLSCGVTLSGSAPFTVDAAVPLRKDAKGGRRTDPSKRGAANAGRGERVSLESRLVYTDREHGGRRREIYLAAVVGAPPPPKGSDIELRFEYDNQVLVFYSSYQGGAMLKNGEGVNVPVWKIRFPREIIQLQRRALFRVRASATEPVEVGVSILGPATDLVDGAGKRVSRRSARVAAAPRRAPDEVDGILWDVSGGGLSFTLNPEPAFRIMPGAAVTIALKLPGVRGPLRLKGQVVARKVNIDGKSVYCVEYTDVDSTHELRRNHNLIFQYVARREREILASLRQSKRWR